MAPMGFLVQVHPYTVPGERHCFVAEIGQRLVGFLGVIPIYARRGWFFEDFLSEPTAPNGTVELLIDEGMRAAAANGVAYVTLGLVPLAGDVGAPLRAVRRWARLLYDFDGLRVFKGRFKPRAWDAIYLSYPPGHSGWSAIVDTLAAFSKGGLLAFGAQTLVRGPAIVMRLLAVLLVPWTLLLSLPGSQSWFPSEACRWGWVAFDAAVAVALYRLSERWHSRLAIVLVVAIGLDAFLTLLQVLTYDIPQHRTPLAFGVILVAVSAPMLAATLLGMGLAHRRGRRPE
jgi:phosphatidylglycerol lysyltransferase